MVQDKSANTPSATPSANDSSDSGIEGIRAARLAKVAELKTGRHDSPMPTAGM